MLAERKSNFLKKGKYLVNPDECCLGASLAVQELRLAFQCKGWVQSPGQELQFHVPSTQKLKHKTEATL